MPDVDSFKKMWGKICRLRATLMIEKEIFDGGVKLQKVPKIQATMEAEQAWGQSRSCCGLRRGTVRTVKIHARVRLAGVLLSSKIVVEISPVQVHPSDFTMMATPRLSARNGGEARVQGGDTEYDYMLVRLMHKRWFERWFVSRWFALLFAYCKKKLDEEEEEEKEEEAEEEEEEEQDEGNAEDDDNVQEQEEEGEEQEEEEEGEDEDDGGGSASTGADPRLPVVRLPRLSVGAKF